MNRRHDVSYTALGRAAAAVLGLTVLGACAEMQGAGSSGASADGPGILRIEEREVERPDIYELEARGLWDGRFSFGGRWVAVAEDVDAERVRITNLANGQQIEGGLYARDVNMPGPPLMVSMDAAQALGMQAGTPVDMRVVVLRTETVEIPAPPPPPVIPEAAEADAGDAVAPVAAGALETTALAAIEAAESAPAAPRAAAATAPAAAAAPAAAQPAGTGRRIQVVGGNNEDGAQAVRRRLQGADIPAEIRTTEAADGTPFYRVIAGPFGDAAAFNAALARIRELGYGDAFATR